MEAESNCGNGPKPFRKVRKTQMRAIRSSQGRRPAHQITLDGPSTIAAMMMIQPQARKALMRTLWQQVRFRKILLNHHHLQKRSVTVKGLHLWRREVRDGAF